MRRVSGYHLEVLGPVSLMTESLITPVCVSTGISSMAAYFILSLALVTKNAY